MAIKNINKLKLGVIGSSEGNGHPFSWSAIFNGYRKDLAHLCPFPVIPEYLSQHSFPEEQLKNASVTHIWTQDEIQSRHIADFANIENVCKNLDELKVCDGILLARDDAESHVALAVPFLQAGIPVFVDKPLALSVKDAKTMIDASSESWMLFSCSSLRYAHEFEINGKNTQPIHMIEAVTPKSWEKYGVHILEPSLAFIPERGKLLQVERKTILGKAEISVKWENATAKYVCSGAHPSELSISIFGENYHEKLIFKDSFYCFKKSLDCFVEEVMIKKTIPISREETNEIVSILELGMLE